MQTFTQIVAIAAVAQLVVAAPLSIQHNARDSTNNPLDGLDVINESTLKALGLTVEDGFKYLPADIIASIEGSIPQKRQATNNPLEGLDIINEGTIKALLVALETAFTYLPADIVDSIKGSIPNFPQKRQATDNPLEGLDIINEGTIKALLVALETAFTYLPADIVDSIRGSIPNFPQKRQATDNPLEGLDIINEGTIKALLVALETAFTYLPADIVDSIKGSIPNFPQKRQATNNPLDGLDIINESTLKALGLTVEDGFKYLPGDLAASIEGSIPHKE